jgi:hypothetical protein
MSARSSFWNRIGWKQGETLGSEDGSVLGTGLFGVCSRGTKLSVWDEILFGGQHYEDILMTLGRLRLEENF